MDNLLIAAVTSDLWTLSLVLATPSTVSKGGKIANTNV